jgi:hypothetical protein
MRSDSDQPQAPGPDEETILAALMEWHEVHGVPVEPETLFSQARSVAVALADRRRDG